MIDDQDEG